MTTLSQINQYSADKQSSEKKIEDFHKRIPDPSCLVTTTVLDTKVGEFENKTCKWFSQGNRS